MQVVIGKAWRGTAFGGTRGRTQLPHYVDKYLAGIVKVDEFVSFNLKLEDINESFHLMHEGKAIRSVVILPHEGDAEVAAHRAKHVAAAK